MQFSIFNFQFPPIQPYPHRASFLRSYPYWLVPALLALGLTLVYLNPFIGDWDAIDYTIYSLRGRPSSMALGRSLFTLTNHVLYVIAHGLFGWRPEQAYLVFKYTVVIQTPLAVIVCWILARDLTGSVKSATLAALLIAFSPLLIIYGSQVMTDVPSVLVSAAAVLLYLRGVQTRSVRLIWAGAALLGLGVNLRETVGLYFPWIIVAPFLAGWKLDRRSVVVLGTSVVLFCGCALGPFAYWFISDPAYRDSWQVWRTSAQSEAARHPWSVSSLAPFLIYFFLVAPLVFIVLPLAAYEEWRARGWSMLLAAAAVGLFANAMLLLNYSTVVNWRYFLTGLPMLAPLAGDFLLRSGTWKLGSERRAFVISVAGIIFVAAVMALSVRSRSREYLARLSQAENYDARLRLMPDNAVVIAGTQTIAVIYWREIGAGHWDTIGVGAGWPQNLEKAIDDYLKAGRRVFLDTDSRSWHPCAWRAAEITELVSIEPRFHFRRVASNLYEIRPRDDSSATDSPNLQPLLPQNRPDEVKKCFNSR